MSLKKHVLIIGGGLSGLSLAWLLKQTNIKITILEASSRLGGRICTTKGALGTPLELGATWFSNQHPYLMKLIETLGIARFPQYAKGASLFQTKSFEPTQQFEIPEAEELSFRIVGGTEVLIDALQEKLDVSEVLKNKKVDYIKQTTDDLIVRTTDGMEIAADIVVSCIPPQLVSRVQFIPEMPNSIVKLLPTIQTWMAGAIKFAAEYSSPFWREKGFSGMLYSHAGIVVEMYDHCNAEENRFAFTGFLNPGAGNYSREVRKEYVINQLVELMGPEAQHLTHYQDKVWNDEYLVKGSTAIHRPHQNNGHPLLQVPYLNGRFYFCGTETATAHPGYMEGAVVAAQTMAQKIQTRLNS